LCTSFKFKKMFCVWIFTFWKNLIIMWKLQK
jgi:hypothetical protein